MPQGVWGLLLIKELLALMQQALQAIFAVIYGALKQRHCRREDR